MRNGAATKELIDRTALRLFANKGIKGTTIRDIAHEARIAEGTMYRHYKSKDELAETLFVENYAALGLELRRIQKKHNTTRTKLDAMIRYFFGVYEKDADMFTYLFLARHRHMQNLSARVPNPYFVFRKVIKDGIVRGEIGKQDPDVATSMVLGLILQVIDSRILGGRIKQTMSRLGSTIIGACHRVLYV